jgi:hypothetical protein
LLSAQTGHVAGVVQAFLNMWRKFSKLASTAQRLNIFSPAFSSLQLCVSALVSATRTAFLQNSTVLNLLMIPALSTQGLIKEAAPKYGMANPPSTYRRIA